MSEIDQYQITKSLRKHQLDAVSALIEVDSIFKKYNIDYFLLAGSALGAIRHKGFIPWDDDIDIGIFLKDRDKAYDALKTELSDKYKWIDENSEKFPRLHGKILYENRGYIDVFILIKTSNNRFLRRIQWVNRKILYRLYKAKVGYINKKENRILKSYIKNNIARVLSAFLPKSCIKFLIRKNEYRYEMLNDNKYYLNLYSIYSLEKELIKTEWLRNKELVLFEEHYFPCVGCTDKYLTHLYGDYMKIPKIEDRIQQHEEIYK